MASAKFTIQADTSSAVKGIEDVSKATNDVTASIGKFDKSAGSLRGEMKKAKTEAMNLAYQLSQLSAPELKSDFGRQLQQQFSEAKQRAAELVDQFADVNEEIKNMASDTRGWDATKEGLKALGDLGTAAIGIYSEFGGSSEKAANILKKMATVQAAVNAAITVGNAIQKQSALMTGLRLAAEKILGVQLTKNAAAEVADAAALGAETAATGAATAATWSFNAALAANPIGAIVAGVAAAAAGIYGLVTVLSQADDETQALTAAGELLNEKFDSEYKKVGENIAKYQELEREYENVRGNSKLTAEFLEREKKTFEDLGLEVDSTKDLELLFAESAGAYIRASNARAKANAAEAAKAELLGKTYSQLATVVAKLARGEEVKWNDIKEIGKQWGFSDEQMLAAFDLSTRGTGAKLEKGAWGALSNTYVKLGTMSAHEFESAFTAELNKMIPYSAVGKYFDTLTDSAKAEAKEASKEIDSIIKKDKKSKGSSKKITKSTKDVKTELEKLDDQIKKTEKEIASLDKTTEGYTDKLKDLKSKLAALKMQRLKFIDTSSIEGLLTFRSALQDIYKTIPEGDAALGAVKTQLDGVDGKLLDVIETASKSDDVNILKEGQRALNTLIGSLDLTSDKFKQAMELAGEFNRKLQNDNRFRSAATSNVNPNTKEDYEMWDNLIEGIRDKKKQLEEERKKYNDILENFELDGQEKTQLLAKSQDNIEKLEEELGLYRELARFQANGPEIELPLLFVDDFNYKKDAKERIARDIEWQQKYIDSLQKKVDKGREYYSPDTFKQLNSDLDEAKKSLSELERKQIVIEIEADIKDYKKQIEDVRIGIAQDTFDSLQTVYDLFAKLPEEIDNCENAFEAFFKIISAGFDIFDKVKRFIEDIKELQKLLGQLDGAQNALEDASNPHQKSDALEDIQQIERNKALDALVVQAKESGISLEELRDQLVAAGYSVDEFNAALQRTSGGLSSNKNFSEGQLQDLGTSEGVDMVSMGGGQDAPDYEEMAEGLEAARDAQIGLTEAQQAGQLAQEGLNVAKEVGTAISGTSAAATAAETVADEIGAAASQKKAVADVSAAGAETAKQNSKMGPWGWIAAIAAAASLIGVLMGMMKFENGGIVGGTSTTGDRILIRANSGEMILNKRQQSHLFKMINDGTVATGAGNLVGTVRVKGSDLHLALSNYDKVCGVNRNL